MSSSNLVVNVPYSEILLRARRRTFECETTQRQSDNRVPAGRAREAGTVDAFLEEARCFPDDSGASAPSPAFGLLTLGRPQLLPTRRVGPRTPAPHPTTTPNFRRICSLISRKPEARGADEARTCRFSPDITASTCAVGSPKSDPSGSARGFCLNRRKAPWGYRPRNRGAGKRPSARGAPESGRLGGGWSGAAALTRALCSQSGASLGVPGLPPLPPTCRRGPAS